jgi:hypothetical protein
MLILILIVFYATFKSFVWSVFWFVRFFCLFVFFALSCLLFIDYGGAFPVIWVLRCHQIHVFTGHPQPPLASLLRLTLPNKSAAGASKEPSCGGRVSVFGDGDISFLFVHSPCIHFLADWVTHFIIILNGNFFAHYYALGFAVFPYCFYCYFIVISFTFSAPYSLPISKFAVTHLMYHY